MNDFILIMSALYGDAHFYWNVAVKLGHCKIFVSLDVDRRHLHFFPKYFNRRAKKNPHDTQLSFVCLHEYVLCSVDDHDRMYTVSSHADT